MRVISALFAAACCLSPAASAFESDVHFGLTKFLALKAGYADAAADMIALGNQRADSGVMDTIGLTFEHACFGKHADAARIVQAGHFASNGAVPAAPDRRAVVAGGPGARRDVEHVLKAAPGKADFLLLKFGAGLHVLQDSWAYQGMPDVPAFADTPVACDRTLASAAPAARGGWASHKADLTGHWPEDVAAMAEATYTLLVQYPPIAGKQRTARDWREVRPLLYAFTTAATKAEKKAWFAAQGITATSFLDGISLPDGSAYVAAQWEGRRLPVVKSEQTAQFNLPDDVKQFYNALFKAWLTSEKPETALGARATSDTQRDLALQFKLWRLRDHGAVADMAHARAPLSRKDQQAIDRISKAPGAYARYEKLSDAVFPLLEQGPGASPLLPFVIHLLPPAGRDGTARAVAVTKLRHAPYDELAVVAEKVNGTWRPVRLMSIVSH